MPHAPSWHLYRTFLAVAEAGSLSAAARALRLTQPTVGRHIDELEQALATPLFVRSSEGLRATPAAEALLPIVREMSASAAAIVRRADAAGATLSGCVRIAASEIMGAEILPPLLVPIQRAHPGIEIELSLSNRTQNLLRRDADIAVRMFRPTQEALVARKIGSVRLGMFAHRDYLAARGTPSSFTEARRFHLIGFDQDDTSARSVVKAASPITREVFKVRSDSDLAQAAAIRVGLGIGVMQLGLAARHPELQRLFADEIEFQLDVWLVMHEDQKDVPAVRAVFDVLAVGLAGWIGRDTY